MPVKIARSAPRPSFGLPKLLVAIHASRQSCSKAGKARIFTTSWGSHPGNPGLFVRVRGNCGHCHRNPSTYPVKSRVCPAMTEK